MTLITVMSVPYHAVFSSHRCAYVMPGNADVQAQLYCQASGHEGPAPCIHLCNTADCSHGGTDVRFLTLGS